MAQKKTVKVAELVKGNVLNSGEVFLKSERLVRKGLGRYGRRHAVVTLWNPNANSVRTDTWNLEKKVRVSG